ncbi:MAG TPA: phosphatase PAP2 family protein [Thermoanaerobaculia bacterium]|nr:phosphatase PAP2 family protein [Thermoanaerobaculia bacterium]
MRRFYFFELFTLANLLAIAVIGRNTLHIVGSPLIWIPALTISLLPYALAGVGVRALIAWARRDRTYFAVIRQRAWIVETLRIVFGTGLMIFTYGWIKLIVPIVHPRLFDQELWDLDRLLFFGLSPNVLFLDIFRAPAVLRAIDWSYANVFYASTLVALAYFFSEPDRRVRVAFANGNAALWIIGGWLYMLVPSLGPAYRFPDLWFVHEKALVRTQELQAVLMRNYQNVLRVWAGEKVDHVILIMFGIGAFPSLHVAFQTYVFLWMRKSWKSGRVLFAIFVVTMFLGSVVTGWHYLIDSIAGIALAWGCYRVSRRAMPA